jgi:membrane associated rhomboid family serine protease
MPSSAYLPRRNPESALSFRPGAARRSSRRAGFLLVAGMAALMWLGEVIDLASGLRLDRYGIEPRETDGLLGILAAPFLHAGLAHVAANTIPFLLLGFLVALGGVLRVVLVTAIVALVGGLGTWLFAPTASLHVGASGIVFGYAGYLLSRGFFSRRLRDFLLAAVIALLWGGALLGGLLPATGISWQGHLFGAVGGVVAGWLLGRPGGIGRGALLRGLASFTA